MARSKLEAYADSIIEGQLEQLDEEIEKLNAKLAVYDQVKDKRDRLVAARRALLGGAASQGGTRIRREDVKDYMTREDPEAEGLDVATIAEGMNTNDAVIRGHLARGNNELFKKRGTKWVVRDPEKGDD